MNFFRRRMHQHSQIRQSLYSSSQQPIIEIGTGTYRLPRDNQQLSVIAGRAWLTVDDKDIIVTAGEQTHVPVGTSVALISSVDEDPVRFSLG